MAVYIAGGDISYDIALLARLMGQENKIKCFSNKGYVRKEDIAAIIAPENQMADVFREIAKVLERNGDVQSALLVAQKALELRPHGPYIQKLVSRLEKL